MKGGQKGEGKRKGREKGKGYVAEPVLDKFGGLTVSKAGDEAGDAANGDVRAAVAKADFPVGGHGKLCKAFLQKFYV